MCSVSLRASRCCDGVFRLNAKQSTAGTIESVDEVAPRSRRFGITEYLYMKDISCKVSSNTL